MNKERPIEPFSTNENPELWAEIVKWQEEYIEQLQAEKKQLKEIALEILRKYSNLKALDILIEAKNTDYILKACKKNIIDIDIIKKQIEKF